MSRSYPGGSNGKKIARNIAYEWARRVLPGQKNTVVALCGPTASDIGPIQAHGITDDPRDVMLIDDRPENLAVATRRWQGVHTFAGEAYDCPLPWSVDLAVLDFCGLVETKANLEAIKHTVKKMRVGSAMILTYTRAHGQKESSANRLARITKQTGIIGDFAKAMRTGGDKELADHIESFGGCLGRARAAYVTIGGLMNLPCCFRIAKRYQPFNQDKMYLGTKGKKESSAALLFAGTLNYFGENGKPMGMALMRVGRIYDLRRTHLGDKLPNEGLYIAGKQGPMDVLRAADKIDAAGIDSSLALDISRGTLAAWRAHRTMGTYGKVA